MNKAAKMLTLAEVAKLVGGTLAGGDPTSFVIGINTLADANVDQLSFLTNPKYARYLKDCQAAAVLIDKDKAAGLNSPLPLILCADAYLAFALLVKHFAPPIPRSARGVHPTAVVEDSAELGDGVSIGANAYIGSKVRLGGGVTIGVGCYIGEGTTLGGESYLHPNVTLREGCVIGARVIIHAGTVIGSDGFGYAKDGAKQVKIPQIGIVEIGDDVEIGANCSIDRAALGVTRIGRGTKIDNLVQIAHNVVIGEDSVIISQVGISGSTELGDRVILAGQTGVTGHLKIGNDVLVLAQSEVSKNIPANEIWFGSPARPAIKSRKIEAALRSLPEKIREIRQLKKRIAKLEENER